MKPLVREYVRLAFTIPRRTMQEAQQAIFPTNPVTLDAFVVLKVAVGRYFSLPTPSELQQNGIHSRDM